jgi:hypothetical protein
MGSCGMMACGDARGDTRSASCSIEQRVLQRPAPVQLFAPSSGPRPPRTPVVASETRDNTYDICTHNNRWSLSSAFALLSRRHEPTAWSVAAVRIRRRYPRSCGWRGRGGTGGRRGVRWRRGRGGRGGGSRRLVLLAVRLGRSGARRGRARRRRVLATVEGLGSARGWGDNEQTIHLRRSLGPYPLTDIFLNVFIQTGYARRCPSRPRVGSSGRALTGGARRGRVWTRFVTREGERGGRARGCGTGRGRRGAAWCCTAGSCVGRGAGWEGGGERRREGESTKSALSLSRCDHYARLHLGPDWLHWLPLDRAMDILQGLQAQAG